MSIPKLGKLKIYRDTNFTSIAAGFRVVCVCGNKKPIFTINIKKTLDMSIMHNSYNVNRKSKNVSETAVTCKGCKNKYVVRADLDFDYNFSDLRVISANWTTDFVNEPKIKRKKANVEKVRRIRKTGK